MRTLLVTLMLLAAGCGTDAGGGSDDCAVDSECPSGACVDGRCEPVEDAGPADVAVIDAQDTSPDASAPDADEPEPTGEFGAPCSTDDDCASGYCIDTPEGRACTMFCSGECPDGYDCRFVVNSGGDAVRICLPELGLLCEPCSEHGDCAPVGVCASVLDGRFCQTFCDQENPCPDRYICNSVTVDGLGDGGSTVVDVCQPESSECVGRRLTNVRPTATGGLVVQGEGRSFVMRGRIGPVSHEASGERYRLVGGF